MSPTIAEWHQRYKQQAGWSAELRRLIYSFPWFSQSQNIIEIGCGTGAILQELFPFQKRCTIGLDIDYQPLIYASSEDSIHTLVQADANFTPFPDSVFDISFCHFLLLWTKYPLHILSEMVRITKSGGWILALAEPDYGGRIDFPVELEELGKLQICSLIEQGANPYIGRTLRSLFSNSYISNVVSGIFGAQWTSSDITGNYKDYEMEMSTLQSDYELLSDPYALIPRDQFTSLLQIERHAWETQTRVLFVPTFYAWGQVVKF